MLLFFSMRNPRMRGMKIVPIDALMLMLEDTRAVTFSSSVSAQENPAGNTPDIPRPLIAVKTAIAGTTAYNALIRKPIAASIIKSRHSDNNCTGDNNFDAKIIINRDIANEIQNRVVRYTLSDFVIKSYCLIKKGIRKDENVSSTQQYSVKIEHTVVIMNKCKQHGSSL